MQRRAWTGPCKESLTMWSWCRRHVPLATLLRLPDHASADVSAIAFPFCGVVYQEIPDSANKQERDSQEDHRAVLVPEKQAIEAVHRHEDRAHHAQYHG